MDAVMSTYARLPVTFVRGEGIWLYDEQDNAYLDALSGIAVCGLGHAHPRLAAAVSDQMQTLVHTSNVYHIANQQQLADRLCQLSGMSKVFFGNSGAEANEAAIKLARLYGKQRSIENPNIIVMEGSFHGRTMATLSATGNRKVRAGFSPLLSGFVRLPYNDMGAVERTAQTNKDVVAVLVEPIQGEGGIILPDADYLQRLRELCTANNWLLMLDEVQTGIARTGKWFAHQHHGVKPDVMTLAKALGNGVPIGACLVSESVGSVLGPGTHGSTFGGNPLSTRAGLTVLELVEELGLAENAHTIGEYLRGQLAEALSGVNGVREIRGQGMMLAIELDKDCGQLVADALQHRLLINVTAGNCVRLLPPLIMTTEEADQLVGTLAPLIKSFCET